MSMQLCYVRVRVPNPCWFVGDHGQVRIHLPWLSGDSALSISSRPVPPYVVDLYCNWTSTPPQTPEIRRPSSLLVKCRISRDSPSGRSTPYTCVGRHSHYCACSPMLQMEFSSLLLTLLEKGWKEMLPLAVMGRAICRWYICRAPRA